MIFRLILWIIIILCVVFFVIFNVEPKVQVHLLPGMTFENIPLALVIIVSFILGLLSGVIISLSQVIKYKMELRKLNKQKELQKKELQTQESSSLEEN
jgi:uncharacterized integral membrane protein